MANENPKVNLALVGQLPDNAVRGTVYMSPDTSGNFIKVGVENGDTVTIFDGSKYYTKSESDAKYVWDSSSPWEPGSGTGSAQLKGSGATTSGSYSVAEGDCTTASGAGSHAEGEGTIASGAGSHTEGKGSITLGDYSHAEGNETYALGDYSHAEGIGSAAFEEGSHSEGTATSAVGLSSHSEGFGECTLSSFTISGAANTTAYTTSSAHNIQANDIILYNNRYAVCTGRTNNTTLNVDRTLDASNAISNKQVIIYKGGAAIGNYSHVEGYKNVAVRNNSHAEGCLVRAIGENSHAEGNTARSDGSCSHAEGYNTVARGECAHAEGYQAIVRAGYAHAEGYKSTADASTSHAEGYCTIARGYISHVEGMGTYSIINSTIAVSGNKITLLEKSILKIGDVVEINGWYAVITEALSDTVFLLDRSIGGTYSVTSLTIYRGIAYGECSHAEGSRVTASGLSSHAEGEGTTAFGNRSHAEGFYTTATNMGEHAQGCYNISHDNTLHSIGFGYEHSADGDSSVIHRNAIEVMNNANTYIYGIGNYDGSTLSGAYTLQNILYLNDLIDMDYNYIFNNTDIAFDLRNCYLYVDTYDMNDAEQHGFDDPVEYWAQVKHYSDPSDYVRSLIDQIDSGDIGYGSIAIYEYVEDIEIDNVTYTLWHDINGTDNSEYAHVVLRPEATTESLIMNSLEYDVANRYCPYFMALDEDNVLTYDWGANGKSNKCLICVREKSDD